MEYFDSALLQKFREGDKAAFEVIFKALQGELRGFLFNNYYHGDEIVNDILAESFYKLFHYRERITSSEHLKRFMYVIVRNLSIDKCRENQKAWDRKNREEKEILYVSSDNEEGTPSERENKLEELVIHLLEIVEKLPKQRRAILVSSFIAGKDIPTIAEEMKLSPQTVRNHRAKAVESLRRTVKFLHLSYPG